MQELQLRVPPLVILAVVLVMQTACERADRAVAPPPALRNAAPVRDSTQEFYDYQHQPVALVVDPTRIVIAAASDPTSEATPLLRALGISVLSSTALVQVRQHWLLHLAGAATGEQMRAAAVALHDKGHFAFVSNVFRTASDNSDVIPVGRVAVQFKAGVSAAAVDSLVRTFGMGIVRPPRPDSGFAYYLLSYPRDSIAPLRVAVALDRNPLVAWADPDKISNRYPDSVPTDPYFSLQYYLSNTNTLNGVRVDDNVEQAWDLTTGQWAPSTGGLRVGVIGTGVQASHPEFAGHVLDGYDAVLGNSGAGCVDCATSPYGNDSHETSVAGIIAAQQDGVGMAGMAPGVLIVPARIFRDNQVASDVGIADAINYTWYYGAAEVINNSWGGGTVSNAITAAIDTAATSGRGGAGTVVVFAAGNTSDRDHGIIGAVAYPAYLDTVIAVGAIDRYGNLTNYTPEGPQLDIVAPSGHYTNICVGDVVTTDLLSSAGCNDGPSGNIDYTSTFSGTSAAAPQVAAVAALIISRQSSLSMEAVKTRLYRAADYWGASTQYGAGKLNAFKSVEDVTVGISGYTTIKRSGSYTWTCSATGGNGTYSYRWDESDNSGGYFEVSTASTYSEYVDVASGVTTIDLKCTVTSGIETGVGTLRANVIAPPM